MHRYSSIFVLLVLLLAPFTNADGLYTKDSAVLQIDGKSFDKLVKNSGLASIVEFYAPWCGHCKNLKPAYEKAAKSLQGLGQVAAVNCDDEKNKAFCGSMGIKGFPTLKTVRPTLKKGKPIIQDYNGGRTAKDIVEAVKTLIPNYVSRVTDKDLDNWLSERNETVKAILFSDKRTTSATMKVLSGEFFDRISIAQVQDKDTEAVSTFGISTYPTLVILPGGNTLSEVFDGEMAISPIRAFLDRYAPAKKDSSKSDKKSKKSAAADSSKSSSDSSTFSAPSASHAASEASSSAAGATTLTVEEDSPPTESPEPIFIDLNDEAQKPIEIPMAPPIPSLLTLSQLQSSCLGPKTSACVLALLPSTPDDTILPEDATQALTHLAEIADKHHQWGTKIFPFYAIPASNPASTQLREGLGLKGSEEVELIAVNGRRGWWRHYTAGKYRSMDVEGWVDGIRMGEGKKEKIPEGLIAEVPQTQAEELVVEIPPAPEAEVKEEKVEEPEPVPEESPVAAAETLAEETPVEPEPLEPVDTEVPAEEKEEAPRETPKIKDEL
ncbi:MAG: hypothetical protein MMC33_009893 [Icmadophila ericetorum]|nr:hypothetical protein [Icmadophila ericetorum]